MSDENFLSRWSRRKSEAAARPAEPAAPDVPAKAEAAAQPPRERDAGQVTSNPESLPSVESLTLDSDFAPFMKPDVDPAIRRAAVKKLMRDPRFNVMDGLDVYIDDYSKPDPLPDGWLEKMTQVARLGIFKEPVEDADTLQKPMPAAPAQVAEAPSAPRDSPDTSSEEIPPPQVGKS